MLTCISSFILSHPFLGSGNPFRESSERTEAPKGVPGVQGHPCGSSAGDKIPLVRHAEEETGKQDNASKFEIHLGRAGGEEGR